jgi:hypothetical protein
MVHCSVADKQNHLFIEQCYRTLKPNAAERNNFTRAIGREFSFVTLIQTKSLHTGLSRADQHIFLWVLAAAILSELIPSVIVFGARGKHFSNQAGTLNELERSFITPQEISRSR